MMDGRMVEGGMEAEQSRSKSKSRSRRQSCGLALKNNA